MIQNNPTEFLKRHMLNARGKCANDNVTDAAKKLNKDFGAGLTTLNVDNWKLTLPEFNVLLDIYKKETLSMTEASVDMIRENTHHGTMPRAAAMTLMAISHIQNFKYLAEVLPKAEYKFVLEYMLDHITPIVEDREKNDY